jgi:hypothetical protein
MADLWTRVSSVPKLPRARLVGDCATEEGAVRELTGRASVHPLTEGEWSAGRSGAVPALPFAPHWGGMSAPGRRFTPVLPRSPGGDPFVAKLAQPRHSADRATEEGRRA